MHDEIESTDDGAEDALNAELDTQSLLFLQLRAQNLELLKIASQVAGYGGNHGPLKSGDVKNGMKAIWEIYAEFYSWVDPEESGDDEEEDEE